MPTVSVVIPVYNIEQHLHQCLDSVAGQSLRDIEVICVDDGSTDGSHAILEEYAAKDSRFRILTQKNGGAGVARNTGMARAIGEYLVFLDSDDWFDCNFLERMVERATETEADVTICRGVEFDTETGQELPSEWMLKTEYLSTEVFAPQEIAEHIFQFTYGMPWDKLYRKAYLDKVGIEFPSLKNSEDLAFVFPTLVSATQIAVTEEVFIHHRVNRKASVSNSRAAQPDAPYEAFQIVQNYLKRNGLEQSYQKSFMNWAMEFLVWHVSNMEDQAIQRAYFSVLREKWLPELKFEQYPAAYYENKATYAKYLLAKYTPYSVFYVVLRIYKWGKRRRME